MNIIDAVWEKRNLGIDVQEIMVGGNEKAEEIRKALKDIKVPYSVIKIPAGNTELLFAAEEMGYLFIETSIRLTGKIAVMEIPPIFKRFEPEITVRQADESMKKKVLDEIDAGAVFETDRIARDPAFSVQTAGIRYGNWARDELERGAELAIAYYKQKPAAFGINRCKEKMVYDAFLGGAFSEEAKRGLGFLALYANMESVRRQGGTQIEACTSSNNLPILRLHMQYGYEIREMHYILVKHQ